MDAYLSHETEWPNMPTLIRRTLTALVHHCLKAENFTEVCDMLVYQLSKDVEGATENTLQNSGYQERLSKILDTLSIIGTVRKGACVTRESRSYYYALLLILFQRSICPTFSILLAKSLLHSRRKCRL